MLNTIGFYENFLNTIFKCVSLADIKVSFIFTFKEESNLSDNFTIYLFSFHSCIFTKFYRSSIILLIN